MGSTRTTGRPLKLALALTLAVPAFAQTGPITMLTVSYDPTETQELAHRTKARYLAQYARPGSEGGWHFLHGSQNNVQAMAKALGITYHYNEARKEYVHPATVILSTPSGKIDRYLYGLNYPEKTLHLSLVESSEG